jgi:hypothetical protein
MVVSVRGFTLQKKKERERSSWHHNTLLHSQWGASFRNKIKHILVDTTKMVSIIKQRLVHFRMFKQKIVKTLTNSM